MRASNTGSTSGPSTPRSGGSTERCPDRPGTPRVRRPGTAVHHRLTHGRPRNRKPVARRPRRRRRALRGDRPTRQRTFDGVAIHQIDVQLAIERPRSRPRHAQTTAPPALWHTGTATEPVGGPLWDGHKASELCNTLLSGRKSYRVVMASGQPPRMTIPTGVSRATLARSRRMPGRPWARSGWFRFSCQSSCMPARRRTSTSEPASPRTTPALIANSSKARWTLAGLPVFSSDK